MSNQAWSVPVRIVAVGILGIACVVLVNYAASLKMGFYTDDYTYLEYAGRLALPQYLVQTLDPRTPFTTYRPLLRLLFLAEYLLFHFESSYYHLTQVLLHLGNCLLLFGIVWRLSGRWRLALVSALVYASLPVYSWAVFWISVHDPSATFFYLAAIWFWILHLQTGSKRYYLYAALALLLSLLGKETSVTAPVAFFLIDRWFVRGMASLGTLLKRYSGIIVVLLAYTALEYIVQINGIFVTEGRYSVGPQILSNLVPYLALLAAPGESEPSAALVWGLVLVFLAITVVRRSAALAFVGIMTLLNLLPVLPIPSDILTGGNYQLEVGLYYLPTMERLAFVDGDGHVNADHLRIWPLSITD